MNAATSETLVLGTAYGYSIEQVRLFVLSLRRHYAGEAILLITSGSTAEMLQFLADNRITALFFDCPKWMVADVQIARYVRYGELLRSATNRYSSVLLTDVGDAVFQGDPFKGAPEGKLLCFQEHEGKTIGECPTNSGWIREIFGEAAVRSVQGKAIICSGTILGVPRMVLKCIDSILACATPEVLMRLGATRGHDQGILNYLLHTGRLPEARVVPNGVHVFTLGTVPDELIVCGPEGRILTKQGVACPIVHQYTYRESLLKHVRSGIPSSAAGPTFFTSTGDRLGL